jgi:hypothetical protein
MRTMVFILAIATLAGCGWSHDPRTTDAAARPNPSTVAVNYKGPDGFNLAVSKADEWCDQHVGLSEPRLLTDDRAAGRATFACEPL